MYGYRSINVTGDWRALYSEQQQNGKEIIVFEMLGTHSQLYQ
jgi:mRNA-degrading endonuclease YafQ of YafQ-DinJ toxin-antitoxin module